MIVKEFEEATPEELGALVALCIFGWEVGRTDDRGRLYVVHPMFGPRMPHDVAEISHLLLANSLASVRGGEEFLAPLLRRLGYQGFAVMSS